jgi:hypothetical protein
MDVKFMDIFNRSKFENIFDLVENEALPPTFVVDWSNVEVKQLDVERDFDEGIAVQPWLIEQFSQNFNPIDVL